MQSNQGPGNLGDGIYFTDEPEFSARYSASNTPGGVRLMTVCDVSLGVVKEFSHPQKHLKAAPEGFDSVKVTSGGYFISRWDGGV